MKSKTHIKLVRNIRCHNAQPASLERSVLPPDDTLEALKECEYALQTVLKNGKVGWLQEEAHKTACKVLEARRQNAELSHE